MSPTIKGRGRSVPVDSGKGTLACARAGAFSTPDDRDGWHKPCRAQCASCRVWSAPDTKYHQSPGQGGRYIQPQDNTTAA